LTRICVTLPPEGSSALIERMASLAPLADMFEVRADLVRDIAPLAILRAHTLPLLFTCRSRSEGGAMDDADPRRPRLLLEAIRRGFEYVDIEHRSGLTDLMAAKAGRGLVISLHDFEGTPDGLEDLYAAMVKQGADVVKIAVTPHSIADVAKLLTLAARVQKTGPRPLVPIAMGPLGVLTRILAGRYGAPFTFASAEGQAAVSPGQIGASLMSDLYRVREVTPQTRVYGVVGVDVTRSLSPALHNRAFALAGIDAVYVPIQAETLEAFVAALPILGLSGFSVTRPYKTAITRYLFDSDETAAATGSVNTVVVRDGLLYGSSTDGEGVLRPLRKKTAIKGRRVVILGAGGAARAAAFALRDAGAELAILARDPERAAALAEAVGGAAHGDLESLALHPFDILINATPLGSGAAPGQTPVHPTLHRRDTVVFDMVYEPRRTPLLRDAEAAGCVPIDGLQMLVAQGAAQFETWTGREAPVDDMLQAALDLTGEKAA
jgi:3-dehydroquinate dehydratase/shikimate dehydrogenase